MTNNRNGLPKSCSVAIVGGGTAGLALSAELRRLGDYSVVVLEREKTAGGVPRHCGHYPFGIREYGRLLKGPDYAKRNVAEAINSGVNVQTETTVTAIHPNGHISLSTPTGCKEIVAQRVVLCTGVRESSRAQRFIGGDRLLGILSTGALQSMVYLHHMRPFRRPIILGSELVSFSAIQTCRHLGIRPVAMIEEQDRVIVHRILQPYTTLMGVPLYVNAKELRIIGREQVEAVEFVSGSGRRTTIETDGVIVSGLFRPESGILYQSHLEIDPATGGPSTDQCGRCSDPIFYSAGNLKRPAETSGWCWQEGVDTARLIAQDLAEDVLHIERTVQLKVSDSAIRFVVPQRITLPNPPNAMSHMQIGLNLPVNGRLLATTGGNTLLSRRLNSRPVRRTLVPLQAIFEAGPMDVVNLSMEESC